MPEIILAKIQRCRYCKKEMSCGPLDYNQNPFCTACLKERVKNAKPKGKLQWRIEGHYAIPEVSQKRRSDERKLHRD
jgi:hypothetical protein